MIKRAYTFDEVALVPQFNNIPSRTEPDLGTWMTRSTKVHTPLIAANMDTVVGPDLAEEPEVAHVVFVEVHLEAEADDGRHATVGVVERAGYGRAAGGLELDEEGVIALELDALGSDHELPGPHAGRGHGGGVHRESLGGRRGTRAGADGRDEAHPLAVLRDHPEATAGRAGVALDVLDEAAVDRGGVGLPGEGAGELQELRLAARVAAEEEAAKKAEEGSDSEASDSSDGGRGAVS